MTSKSNEMENLQRGKKQQQPTSRKPPGGSLKQVPLLGVLLRFLTSQVGYLTRVNYAQKYDLTKASAADPWLNWPSDPRKDDLDLLADKKKTCYLNSL